MKHVASYLDI